MVGSLTTIPLSKLTHADANVRKMDTGDGLEELAANIEALGILQSLAVRPTTNGSGKPPGTYEVLAGGRRLRALQHLLKKRRIPKDYPVPCQVHEKGSPVEVSLAENAIRSDLHPADQFEAFKALHDEGLGADDIAARFGVAPLVVRQRLKLAAVSPNLIACYREGDMTLEQLMAFTVTDDQAAQERVWFEGQQYHPHPQAIRRALTSAHVDGSDRRARFVGAEAYEAAGGTIVRDLFRPDDLGYFTDQELLDRLVAEKLAVHAEEIKQEGWRWVEVVVPMDYGYLANMSRLQPVATPRDKKDQAKLAECEKRYDELAEEYGEDPPENVLEKLEALAEEINRLSEPILSYKEEGKKRAGVILSLNSVGELLIERGLIKPEDRTDAKKASTGSDGSANNKKARSTAAIPEALQAELSVYRTAALQETIAGNPGVALDALVYVLAARCLYDGRHAACVDIKPTVLDPRCVTDAVAESAAVSAMSIRLAEWRKRLPATEALWPWVVEQNRKTKLELLACCVAMTVNAVRVRHDLDKEGRLAQADVLAAALNLDMAKWWEASRATYLSRVSKAQILTVVEEAVSKQAAENISGMKKDAMAARAEELIAGKKWLPEPLRMPRAR